jgi:hypothetical protein
MHNFPASFNRNAEGILTQRREKNAPKKKELCSICKTEEYPLKRKKIREIRIL